MQRRQEDESSKGKWENVGERSVTDGKQMQNMGFAGGGAGAQ